MAMRNLSSCAEKNPRATVSYEAVLWQTTVALRDARWTHLNYQAKQPTIRRLVDHPMGAIERNFRPLKYDLRKDSGCRELDNAQ